MKSNLQKDQTESQYSPDVWFSPRFVIYLLWSLRNKLGEVVITSGKYKKEREAWAVAVALLGIIKMTKNLWWVQIPEEDPPDILAMTVAPNLNEGWNYANYRKVEVMGITKYSNETIVNEILNKTKDKYYEKETCLLVHIKRDSKISDMRQLADELKGKVYNLADVWVIGNTEPCTNRFVLFSIFPDVQVENYNLDDEIAKLPPGDTLEMERAKGTQMKLVRGVFLRKFNPGR